MTTELRKIKSIKDHRGGGLILSMDYSTLEVRIFCAICGDPLLKEVLNSGKDLHCQTARAIFPELKGLSDKEIKEHHNGLRSKAKSCFVAGTQVLMADNKTKNIEDIKPGEFVISKEESTNRLILSEVVESKETRKTRQLIELEFDNESILRCTPDHLIRLKNGKYKEAKLLTEDDEIDSINTLIKIKEIETIIPISVYDIEVLNESNSHNFCANGVFVHNCIFGLLYGKSTFNFAKEWGCTIDEAQVVLDGLLGAYPAIKTYVNEQHEFAKKNGYVVNMFGQKRPLPGAQLPEFGPTRKQFKHAMNAAQNSGIQCFTGDTKIDLLDGTTVTIDSLVNNFDNKYVLSCCEDGHIIPGKIINAMQTGITDRLCKIKLDNEEIIQCTPEHQFMLKDGTYKHAIDLKPSDGLMTNKLNCKIISIGLIALDKEVPVYDIEIENKNNTHNFALSAGVFVHNSSASIMAWIAGTHVQEEFCLQNMQSVMIGGVHDSTYVDVYPKELIKCMKIFNFHAEIAANKIHNWMNGVHLPADFGLGQSWGRELDVKKWELHDGNMCQLTLKGGDVNWEYLKRELDEAYDYKIVSIEDGDAITEEEHENIPVRQSNKYVTVTLDFIDPDPNIEYKSKYYVGNGTFGKRVDTRENPIKSLL